MRVNNNFAKIITMKRFSKAEDRIGQRLDKVQNRIQLNLYVKKMVQIVLNLNRECELNSKIFKISTTIKDQYPELSKYIKEKPMAIPGEKNTEIMLKKLQKYYDSLNSILDKYILEHSNIKK